MKKSIFFVLAVMTIALVAGPAFAQGDGSIYLVTYFSNANTVGAPDGTLRLINDGTQVTSSTGGHPTNGNLYASLYIFDDSQEMQECCNCFVSPDGLLSESVNNNLMNNTLTGGQEEGTRGVIKILSSSNPDPTHNVLRTGLRGTMTHIQTQIVAVPGLPPSAFAVSETQLADSNLSVSEKQDLEITCGFVEYLGSGQGVCSCTPEGSDF